MKRASGAATRVVSAGAIDEKIGRSPPTTHGFITGGDLGGIGHVAPQGDGLSPDVLNAQRPGFGLVETEIHDGHAHTHFAEGLGHGAAKFATAPGDGDDSTAQIERLQHWGTDDISGEAMRVNLPKQGRGRHTSDADAKGSRWRGGR